MTALLIASAYTGVALLVARWFYRINAKDAGSRTPEDAAIDASCSLLYGLFWPVVLAWLGAIRFIARPHQRAAEEQPTPPVPIVYNLAEGACACARCVANIAAGERRWVFPSHAIRGPDLLELVPVDDGEQLVVCRPCGSLIAEPIETPNHAKGDTQ